MGDTLLIMDARHNHVKKLLRLIEEGKLPRDTGLSKVNVYHDDWCAIWAGGFCNCDPDLRYVPPAAPGEDLEAWWRDNV